MGFFEKIKEGLKKTRDALFGRIDKMLKSFTKIDDELFEELEELLVMGDVGMYTAEKICNELKKRVQEEGITDPREIKRLLEEVVTEMLKGGQELDTSSKPSVILVIGVNGVGKTTTIGKLAAKFKKDGKKVILAAADTFRAAAIDQLEIWAQRANADIVKQNEGSDPAAVVFDAISAAKARGADIIIADTAGRLHNKKNLMGELAKINRIIDRELPDSAKEVLLVLDATTGQNAVNQARLFSETAPISGIVLTKLDGTAKGGVVLAIKEELDVPVKFIGVGEQVDDLQPFVPEEFAKALFADENTIEEAAKAEAAEENKAISEQTDDEAVQEEHIPATADIWAQIDAEAQAEKQSLAEDEEAVKQKELGEQKAREEAEKERQRKREERKSRAKKRNWSTDTTSSESTDTAGDDDWLKSWREGNGENK